MRRRSAFIFLFLGYLVFGGLGLFSVAFAQSQTPAGTVISNTASASYTDAAGQTVTVNSLPVTTTVTAVYAFEITPDGTSPAAPGQTVSAVAGEEVTFVYELTNNANSSDTFALSVAQDATDGFDFTNVQIYIDNDGDGAVSPGDTLYDPASPATYPTLTAGGTAGDSVQILVVGTIPSGTATGVGNLNLIGTSQGNNTLTDNNNWAQANASSEPALTLDKSVSPTTGVVPGTTLTYSLTGGNTGASNPYAVANVATVNGNVRSGFLISDDFDDDLVFGSVTTASYTPAVDSAVGIVLYSSSPDGSTPVWTTTRGADVNAVGYLIPFRTGVRFDSALTSYQLTFTVSVPTTATSDDSYSNTGVLRFDRDGEGDSDDAGETVTTAPVVTEVDQVDAVALGPNAYPNGDAPAGSYVEGGITISRNADAQTVASVNNGSTVTFRHSIVNNGNATDTYDLTVPLPAGFPGTVTITDVNGNTIGDITLTQGQIGTFLVTVTIPDDYVAATPTTFTVTATSQNNSALSDSTTDTLTTIVEDDTYGVTLDNGDGDTGIENISGTTLPATPGTPVSFPLELTNDGNNNPDTFTLSSTNGVPGSTLTIYRDTDCDGVQDAGEPVVTGSITLAPGENICLVAVATVPAGTAAGSYPVSVTATSTLNAGVTSTITNTIAVGVQTTAFTLEPNGSATVDPGTQHTYTHTITNSSNAPASVDIPAVTGAPTGWVYEYSIDGGTTWVSAITDLNVPANGTQGLLVRVTVPANAPDNASHTATITATATYPDNSTAVDPVTDTTTVTDGSLSVVKTVDETEAAPGENLTYTITATNNGTRPLNNVRVYDTLPDNAGTAIADTEFVSVSATADFAGTVLYSTNGTTWSATAPTSLGASGTFYVGVDTAAPNDAITTADIMPVDGEITVTFVVQVADGQ